MGWFDYLVMSMLCAPAMHHAATMGGWLGAAMSLSFLICGVVYLYKSVRAP